MSYDQYLLTTMTKGLGKIIPIVVTIVVGYFVFIKLPFFFFRRTLRDIRRERESLDDQFPKFPEEPRVMKLEEKIKRDAEELKREQQKAKKEEPRKEEPKREQKKEQKKEEPRREAPKRPAPSPEASPETVFELRPGQKFTQDDLKAKYRELLKQSHPDRVASMGPDFRKLAEKKTKEINEAYEKLKKKAS